MTVFEYGICFIAGVVFITLGILYIRKITSFKTEVRAEYVKIPLFLIEVIPVIALCLSINSNQLK